MGEAEFYTKYKVLAEDKSQLVSPIELMISILYSHDDMYSDLDVPGAVSPETRRTLEHNLVKFVSIADENPILYHFVRDTDKEAMKLLDPEGTRQNETVVNGAIMRRSRIGSDFFVPWIASLVPRSIALEVCYGYGVDFKGEYREIPQTDPFFYFCHKNDLFVAIVERGLKTVEWLDELKPEKMLFLGAGMAPELRHLGLKLDKGQKAILIDHDTTINPEFLFKDISFRDQIEYQLNDIALVVANPETRGFGAVTAMGLIPYVWGQSETSFSKLLVAIFKNTLEVGGSLIFELYPEHWEWYRNRDIKGFYMPLKLFPTIDTATELLKNLLCALQLDTSTEMEVKKYYDDFGKELMGVYRITRRS